MQSFYPSSYSRQTALEKALEQRNKTTTSTWHYDGEGIQIKMADGRIVHLRKGTVVSVVGTVFDKEFERVFLRVEHLGGSGRNYPHDPAGFSFRWWSQSPYIDLGGWLNGSTVHLYPGCDSSARPEFDLSTMELCASPDGRPSIPRYELPTPDLVGMGLALVRAVRATDIAEARRLLDAGADVNKMYGFDRQTAFHWACCNSKMLPIALRLIAAGAVTQSLNKDRATPLMLCGNAEYRAAIQEAIGPATAPAVPAVPTVPTVPTVPAAPTVPATVLATVPAVPVPRPMTKREAILAALRPS